MEIRSLGYRTDLIFPAFDGEIVDRGTYLVVRTPTNPGFYWGNFLLFASPPGPDDFSTWRRLFREEIGSPPKVHHQTFGWDSPSGETGHVQPFLDAGFTLNRQVVLTARRVDAPAKYNDEVEIRPLRTDEEWEQAFDNQIRCRPAEHELDDYRVFKRQQLQRYRAMADAGLGAWFGAFLDGYLVGDLGIFRDRNLGRYQSVETDPDFRRRGIASTLVFRSARYAFEQMGIRTLVIVAEEDHHAAKIYESVGFQVTERQVGLEWSE